MFTSRAEYRLLLRQDNADRRLMRRGSELRLVGGQLLERLNRKESLIDRAREAVSRTSMEPELVNPYLRRVSEGELGEREKVAKLLKRPNVKLVDLLALDSLASEPVI